MYGTFNGHQSDLKASRAQSVFVLSKTRSFAFNGHLPPPSSDLSGEFDLLTFITLCTS